MEYISCIESNGVCRHIKDKEAREQLEELKESIKNLPTGGGGSSTGGSVDLTEIENAISELENDIADLESRIDTVDERTEHVYNIDNGYKANPSEIYEGDNTILLSSNVVLEVGDYLINKHLYKYQVDTVTATDTGYSFTYHFIESLVPDLYLETANLWTKYDNIWAKYDELTATVNDHITNHPEGGSVDLSEIESQLSTLAANDTTLAANQETLVANQTALDTRVTALENAGGGSGDSGDSGGMTIKSKSGTYYNCRDLAKSKQLLYIIVKLTNTVASTSKSTAWIKSDGTFSSDTTYNFDIMTSTSMELKLTCTGYDADNNVGFIGYRVGYSGTFTARYNTQGLEINYININVNNGIKLDQQTYTLKGSNATFTAYYIE